MKKKIVLPAAVILFLCVSSFSLFYIKIPYTINGNGIIKPTYEWRLDKTLDGRIVNTLKNNLTNTVPEFTATEFQRGDLVEFIISRNLGINIKVFKGDTIGTINSYIESLKLLQMRGELEEKIRLRDVYLTGEKPENVEIAYQEMVRAEQELLTQQKITERIKTLHNEQLIADQEYEISQNDLNNMVQTAAIKRASYQSMISGAKKEEIALVDAAILQLRSQIEITEKRIDAFTITAPITGILLPNGREITEMESLARIISVDSTIIVLPVDISELQYIKTGSTVKCLTPINKTELLGYIYHIDNEIQQLNQRQMVFVASVIDYKQNDIMPNLKVSVKIETGEITIAQYFTRLLKTVYNN